MTITARSVTVIGLVISAILVVSGCATHLGVLSEKAIIVDHDDTSVLSATFPNQPHSSGFPQGRENKSPPAIQTSDNTLICALSADCRFGNSANVPIPLGSTQNVHRYHLADIVIYSHYRTPKVSGQTSSNPTSKFPRRPAPMSTSMAFLFAMTKMPESRSMEELD